MYAHYSPTGGIIYNIKIRRVCTWSQCLISSFASEPGDGRQSAVACPSSNRRLRGGRQRWRWRSSVRGRGRSIASRCPAQWISRVPLFSRPESVVCVCVHNIILCFLPERNSGIIPVVVVVVRNRSRTVR